MRHGPPPLLQRTVSDGMTSRQSSSSIAVAFLGILAVPLLVLLAAKFTLAYFQPLPAAPDFIIDLEYVPSSTPGVADKIEGHAPSWMELGIYLNDALIATTTTGLNGHFSAPVPVLPLRRNQLMALPTRIDPSILLLLYTPTGAQSLFPVARDSEPGAPFLAAIERVEGGLQVYGSTEAVSQIEIYEGGCVEGKAHLAAESDDEGSFSGMLPLQAQDQPLPERLCARLRPDDQHPWMTRDIETLPQVDQNVIDRQVLLEISPDGIKFTFTVEMPAGYRVYQNLVQGGIGELEFIEYLFGEVSLNTYLDPRRVTWRQEKQSGSERVRVILESQTIEFLVPEETATTFEIDATGLSASLPQYTLRDRVAVVLAGTHLIQSAPPPTASSADRHDWEGTLATGSRLRLWVSRGDPSGLDPIQKSRLQDSLSRVITGLGVASNPLLEQTVEGQLVGILPARVSRPVQAQVYDYYRTLYLKEPLVAAEPPADTLRTFARDLPGRLPDALENVLFGSLWLIPSALLLLAVRKEAASAKNAAVAERLRPLAWNTVFLIVISLDWLPLFDVIGVTRDGYIIWAAAAYLTCLLVRMVFPSRVRRVVPVALTGILATALASAILYVIPDGWGTILLSSLSLTTLAGLAWQAATALRQTPAGPSSSLAVMAVLAAMGVSFPHQALPLVTQFPGNAGVLTQSIALLRPLVPIGLLIGGVLLLARAFDKRIGEKSKPFERGLGRFVFVAFAVGFSPSWGFVPVATLVSLVLFEWLLPEKPQVSASRLDAFLKTSQMEAVTGLLKLNRELRLRRMAENDLQKQVREGKLSAEDYAAQLDAHEAQIKALLRPDFVKALGEEITVKELAFNFGAGPRHRDNLRRALAWATLLLVPMTLIHGWPLASATLEQAGAFPLLYVGSQLGSFVMQYLAMAAFMGYFFPYLRGRNGLEKGGWVAGTIVFSLLPVQLLTAATTFDLMALVVWAGGILAFNLLIGLLAFDLPTIAACGLRWNQLTDLYNFRELIVYLTGSGAPLVTTIVSAIAGNLEELVPSILRVVFPSMSLTSAQSELLQVLFELATSLTSKLLN